MNEFKINEVKWEHLKSPDLIIKTWIYNSPQEYHLVNNHGYSDNEPFLYIDYDLSDRDYAKECLFIWVLEDNHGFAISKISESNKYSLNFRNCTWIVAVWISKLTGQNISILTHQDPQYFLSKKKTNMSSWWHTKQSYFIECLEKIIWDFKDQCEEWTIDVVIFWWNSNDNFIQYQASISLLEKTLKYILWFHPVIVWWPSLNNDGFYNKWVFLDTKNRRVHYYKNHTNCNNNITSTSSEESKILKWTSESKKQAFLHRIKRIFKK